MKASLAIIVAGDSDLLGTIGTDLPGSIICSSGGLGDALTGCGVVLLLFGRSSASEVGTSMTGDVDLVLIRFTSILPAPMVMWPAMERRLGPVDGGISS